MKNYLILIDSYLGKKITFKEFWAEIEKIYSNDKDFNSYPKEVADFIDEVYEKSTYASEALAKDDHDRGYGLIDSDQYYTWLNEMKEKNIRLWKSNGDRHN